MQEINNQTENSKLKLKTVLAQIVKKHRNRQNKSISKISAEIMMPKSMWLDLERGIKDPQLTTFWKVAEALNMPVESLIVEIKNKLGKDFSLIE